MAAIWKVEPSSVNASIEQLIEEVQASAAVKGKRQIAAWHKPARDLQRLVRRDYVRSLRRHLDFRRVRTLLAAFENIFPGFNLQPIGGTMSLDAFERMSRGMQLHFQASPQRDNDGMALRGFYVSAQNELKRPLIYLNTAHHPVAVATTFCHELGHHMVDELIGLEGEPVHFFFDADYASHLDMPGELAADAMVSFAAYPAAIARRIFATEWNWGLVARAQDLGDAEFVEIRRHVKEVYGFDLAERLPASQRLTYLAGMIHFAKLRWALLNEYNL